MPTGVDPQGAKVNPIQEVLDHVEAGVVQELMRFLDSLSAPGRRAVARQLPAHLAERLRSGVVERRGVQSLAPGYRLAGAACLSGAEQVAKWLDRRELRWVSEPEADAARISLLLRSRPEEWRADLAVRLVRRLRPPARAQRQRLQPPAGWDLAAALVEETSIEPPDNDAFVAGWVQRLAERRYTSASSALLAEDRLLDYMLPRLFSAAGVAERLSSWNYRWPDGSSLIQDVVALARAGRVSRELLLDGCMGRFLAGGDGSCEFVTLRRALRPEVAEIPVADCVNLLPSASSSVLRLVLEELGRADRAGALDDELFAEAVQALTHRREKKNIAAGVKWMADAPPPRGAVALAALAPVFDVDTPALRERAVRLAVRLAPHAAPPSRELIREAANRLPTQLRERVAAAYGAADPAGTEAEAAPTPMATPLPALPPPITSVDGLADELGRLRWPNDPAQFERILAALVELTHGDRTGVVAALQPWWRETWRHPFDARAAIYGDGAVKEEYRSLLRRCVLAVVSPADGRELSALLNHQGRTTGAPALGNLAKRRFREIISLFERDRTIPVLLATPTEPTGHVAAETLLARLERLGDTEPLEADFLQALLRLPRSLDPALSIRAEKLLSDAGRRTAAWLRDGGLPDPEVTWEFETINLEGGRGTARVGHARLTPPAGVPQQLATLCAVSPDAFSPREMAWWPPILPSHREVVAAHVLEFLPLFADDTNGQVEVVQALVHGDGPVGAATASTIVIGMGNRLPMQWAAAANAFITLAACRELPTADLGRAVADRIITEQVKLSRIAGMLAEIVAAGAHVEVWAVLAEALPRLLPDTGNKARAGLGELLKVARRAATRAGARGDIPGLSQLAAREGKSLLLHEARHLHEVISS